MVERVYPPKIMMMIANPLMRWLVPRGGGGPAKALMLVHLTGRKTGRAMTFPVARQTIDGQLCALSNSGWRFNFRGGYDCELTVDGRRRRAHGTLVDDVDQVTAVYQGLLGQEANRNARRTGLRINVDRPPTRDELADAVRRYGMSYIRFDLRD